MIWKTPFSERCVRCKPTARHGHSRICRLPFGSLASRCRPGKDCLLEALSVSTTPPGGRAARAQACTSWCRQREASAGRLSWGEGQDELRHGIALLGGVEQEQQQKGERPVETWALASAVFDYFFLLDGPDLVEGLDGVCFKEPEDEPFEPFEDSFRVGESPPPPLPSSSLWWTVVPVFFSGGDMPHCNNVLQIRIPKRRVRSTRPACWNRMYANRPSAICLSCT